MEFAGFKTAVVVDPDSKLTDIICDEKIFRLLSEDILPEGWGCNATGVSGAAGFYIEFAIDHLPSEIECAWVMGLLQEANKETSDEEATNSTDIHSSAD